MESLLAIKDPEAFYLDLIASHKEIYRLCVKEYLQGDNTSARIGALRLLRDLNLDFMEMIVLKDTMARVANIEGKMIKGSVLVEH